MPDRSKSEHIEMQRRSNIWQLRINGPVVAVTGGILCWMTNWKLTGVITLLCGLTAFGLSFVLFRKPNNDTPGRSR